MFTIPSLPPWDGAHPIIVHFPIALLSTSPLLLLAALAAGKHRLTWMIAYLLLTLLGTLGAWLATWSGDAAEHAVRASAEIESLIHEHEEAGELARNLFLGIGGAAALGTFLAWKVESAKRRGVLIIGVILVAHAVGTLALINAGHLGGLLVHEHGVRARMRPDSATSPIPAAQATPDTKSPDSREDAD